MKPIVTTIESMLRPATLLTVLIFTGAIFGTLSLTATKAEAQLSSSACRCGRCSHFRPNNVNSRYCICGCDKNDHWR
jgi:hypothetical protein